MPHALDDVTVVSFGQIAQAPLATQMLADLGAEVLKIERPGGERVDEHHRRPSERSWTSTRSGRWTPVRKRTTVATK
jgi:crotonobetainyl-CoA:carnitine CoA-transferase CaiB-like acyl-CoA transferase